MATPQAGKTLPSFDLVAEKFEAVLDMHNPCLLRVQFHAQFLQNPNRCRDGCSRPAA
jgi:hypothetical protein